MVIEGLHQPRYTDAKLVFLTSCIKKNYKINNNTQQYTNPVLSLYASDLFRVNTQFCPDCLLSSRYIVIHQVDEQNVCRRQNVDN